jgi:hypothetical protein
MHLNSDVGQFFPSQMEGKINKISSLYLIFVLLPHLGKLDLE